MIFVLAAISALILAGFMYRRTMPELSRSRRYMLFGLRAVSIFILISILLSPILRFSSSKSQSPGVLFLQDNSLSMELERDGVSKAQLLAESQAKLMKKYRDAGYEIFEQSFADGIKDGRDNSLLIKSLREIGQDLDLSSLSGIVLASDGWLRDEDFGLISRLGSPLYPLADSSRYHLPDLEISSLEANRYAYRNESAIIRARVKARNFSGRARAHLYLGDARVASESVDLTVDVEEIIDFSHRFTQTGFYNYRVELEALADEQRLGNNQMPGAIEVLSDKELIIVISDAPAWDNKFILDAIATNPRWQSESYLIREGRTFRGDQPQEPSPGSRPAVIVMINNGNLRLSPALLSFVTDNLARGTGLYYQGMPIPALQEQLPLLPSNISSLYQGFVRLGDNAAVYPMFNPLSQELSKLPPLDYYYLNPAPTAEVLASMNNPQNSPGIAILNRAESRALGISFLNLWRWQMQSPEGGYQKMIVNILTWLGNKAIGAYSAIYKSSYLQGEEITIRLRAEDDIRYSDLDKSPLISIFDAEGNQLRQDFMSRQDDGYSFSTELEVGDYRFEIREPDRNQSSGGSFAVSAMVAEERDFDFNLPLLNFLAAQSNQGQMIYLSEIEEFNPPKAQLSARIIRREIALYRRWYIISLFILSFCLELFFRRRWGLL